MFDEGVEIKLCGEEVSIEVIVGWIYAGTHAHRQDLFCASEMLAGTTKVLICLFQLGAILGVSFNIRTLHLLDSYVLKPYARTKYIATWNGRDHSGTTTQGKAFGLLNGVDPLVLVSTTIIYYVF